MIRHRDKRARKGDTLTLGSVGQSQHYRHIPFVLTDGFQGPSDGRHCQCEGRFLWEGESGDHSMEEKQSRS